MSFGAGLRGVAPGRGLYNRRAMQPVTVHEQVEYASLGWRFTAVLIDTVVLFCIWTVMLLVDMVVIMGQSSLNASDPAAAQALSREITQKIVDQQLGNSNLLFYVIVFGSLFIYYLLLEAFFAASVGKLVCRMRVTMVDGSRPGGVGPRRAQPRARAGGHVLLHPLRHLVLREPAPRAPRRPRGAHRRRPAAAGPRRWGRRPGAGRTAPGRTRIRPGRVRRTRPPPAPLASPAPGPQYAPAAAPVAAGPQASGRRARAAQDGGAGRARRAPQLPALLGARAGGRRRRPREGLLGRVRERLVHAHGLGRGAARRARRCRRLRSSRGAHRRRSLRAAARPCAPAARTGAVPSPPTATTRSTRRSWPWPARTLLAPDAAMGGALEAPPTHQGGF